MAHRRRRYFLISLVLLGLLTGGAIWFWTRSTSGTLLAQAKAELRARGERLDAKDFASGEGADPAPLAALAVAITNFSDEADWPGSFLAMHCVSAGYARALWRQPEIPLFGEDTGSWHKLEMDIEGAEAGLARCREVLSNPPPSSGAFGFHGPYAETMEWWRAAQWLQGAVFLHLHRQDLDQALANLLSLVNATRVYQDDLQLFLQLTRQEIGRIALASTWEALQTPGWTDAQLVQLQTAWDQVRFVEPLVDSLEAFRVSGLIFFQQVRQEPRLLRNLGPSRARFLTEQWHTRLWGKLRADQDELYFLRDMQGRIDAARLIVAQRNWQAAQTSLNSEEFDAERFMVSASLSRSSDEALLRAVRLVILREMACTAIALRRCQLVRGQIPNQLEELVPEFLKEMPADYMNGQPLRYRLQNTNHWLLYSVGLDGADDQGLAGDQSNFEDPWLGPDWVWPRAVAE